LLTDAVEPDASEASEVISEAWFYVATLFSIFWHKYGIEDAGIKKAGIFLSHFQSENESNGYRCSERDVFPDTPMHYKPTPKTQLNST